MLKRCDFITKKRKFYPIFAYLKKKSNTNDWTNYCLLFSGYFSHNCPQNRNLSLNLVIRRTTKHLLEHHNNSSMLHLYYV